MGGFRLFVATVSGHKLRRHAGPRHDACGQLPALGGNFILLEVMEQQMGEFVRQHARDFVLAVGVFDQADIDVKDIVRLGIGGIAGRGGDDNVNVRHLWSPVCQQPFGNAVQVGLQFLG